MGDRSNSVLVIGGGIAGIQASLDLAERGIKVELVEPSLNEENKELKSKIKVMDLASFIGKLLFLI